MALLLACTIKLSRRERSRPAEDREILFELSDAAVSKRLLFSPADSLVAQTVVDLAIWTARLRRLSTIMKVRIHRIAKWPPASSMAQSRGGYNLSPGLCPHLFIRFRTLMLRRRRTDGQSRRTRARRGAVFVRGRKFERQAVIVGHFCCLF
jgi:hypothetical protein